MALVDELAQLPETQSGAAMLALSLECTTDFGRLGHGASEQPTLTLYHKIRHEIHILLCTSSPIYDKERKLISGSGVGLVSALSAAIATQIGMAAAAISPLIAVAIYVPVKIGTNTWCRQYTDLPNRLSHPEMAEIHLLTK